jgi:two-component system, response regulator YesN
MTILVIEDEELILDGIVDILKTLTEFPCKVLKAYSGTDGLKISRKLRPNLIITDIVMPNMTGLDLIESAQKENICKNFVILSGHDKFSFAQRAIRCGVIDYILKPIDKERLLSAVTQVYRLLPQQCSIDSEDYLPDIPFFNQKFDDSEYPASLKQVISYIQRNFTKDISLQSISEHLFLHPSYISSLINKYMGLSFINYLDFVRVTKAAKLLINNHSLSVSEVSYLSGYNNERRLYNVFQKYLQMTPGDFRSKYENFN